MYLFKFDQNQQTGSGDRVRKRLFFTVFILYRLVTLKIRSRLPKSNQLFSPSQQCIYASLLKIHVLVQKIMSGKESMQTWARTQTGPTPKSTCLPLCWGYIINQFKHNLYIVSITMLSSLYLIAVAKQDALCETL